MNNNIISEKTRNTDYFTKTTNFQTTFEITKCTTEQQNILKKFNFQHSQITQKVFEQLAKLLLKYPMV